MRGGTEETILARRIVHISIHPPHAGWDDGCDRHGCRPQNFNPPTPCGVGPLHFRSCWACRYFNPPTPYGVGLHFCLLLPILRQISIHPPHTGWDFVVQNVFRMQLISIHPPHTGWDQLTLLFLRALLNFNPPTPYGVGLRMVQTTKSHSQFQSTHPIRGGTSIVWRAAISPLFQSTHPIRGGTCKAEGAEKA